MPYYQHYYIQGIYKCMNTGNHILLCSNSGIFFGCLNKNLSLEHQKEIWSILSHITPIRREVSEVF